MSARAKIKPAHRQRKELWTRESLIVLIALLLFVGLGVVVYKPNGKVANNPASVPPLTATAAVPIAPAAPLSVLPEQLLGVELKAANGSTFKLGDFSDKVLLVNFWASWCGPCRAEVPALVALHKQFRSRGVQIVGLSTENPTTSAESVRKFVDEFKVDYPIGWATPELYAALTQGTDRIPQSFIFARDGHLVKHFTGFGSVNTQETVKAALEEALNEKR